MALIYADRVKETTTTTGTGTIDLDGAVSGFQTFNAAMNTADTCYYCIVDGTAWEVGVGTFTDASPCTLTRAVTASTNSNNPINLSAGTKEIFMTITAANMTSHFENQILQIVSGKVSATTAALTTQMVKDSTIPQNTEGSEILTVSITPKSASSKLLIQGVAQLYVTGGTDLAVGIFRDTTADAIGANIHYGATANSSYTVPFYANATSNSTANTTFKLRVGPCTAVNMYANFYFGGVIDQTRMTITEYL